MISSLKPRFLGKNGRKTVKKKNELFYKKMKEKSNLWNHNFKMNGLTQKRKNK